MFRHILISIVRHPIYTKFFHSINVCRVFVVFLINQGKQCTSCYYGCLFFLPRLRITYVVSITMFTRTCEHFRTCFSSYTCVHPFSQVTIIFQTTLLFCSSIWTYTTSCTHANNSQVETVRYSININYRILSLISIRNCTYILIQLFWVIPLCYSVLVT
jgi:hypothetical protein